MKINLMESKQSEGLALLKVSPLFCKRSESASDLAGLQFE
jgi:hypothetical protein